MKTKKKETSNSGESGKWVVINKFLVETDPVNSVRIFGSITKIVKEKFLLDFDGKPLTYDMLRNRISEKRFWKNEKWIIKECPIERSKR